MSMTIVIEGVELPMVDYVVSLVKKGRYATATRQVQQYYGIDFSRARKAVKVIIANLAKKQTNEFFEGLTREGV